ncbi:MAG: tyrosine-type recombinase/integrase [Spirochaetales bacterium]|nr:tyrosine-type recombinase/integrase [Spirochaetales bacterium]
MHKGHMECPYILDKVKRNKRLPAVLNRDEIIKILDQIKNNKHYCMIGLMYAGGLRVSEVVKLRIQDLLPEQLQLYVRRSKGHKDRISLLSDKLLSGLDHIIKNRAGKELLFLTQQNKKYTVRTIQAIFEKAMKKSGIQKKATCHTLRHSFATHLIESGTNVKAVKNLLGHKSVKTTMVYIHLADTFTKDIVSPL